MLDIPLTSAVDILQRWKFICDIKSSFAADNS